MESFNLILAYLTERFEQNGSDMYSNMQDLLLLAATKKSYDELLEEFLSFYKNNFDKELLRGQLKTLSNSFPVKENTTFDDMISYFKGLGEVMKSLLSEVVKVMKLILTVPASNASSERCFSKLKLIKTYLRASMTQERLNHFMILGIYPELLDSLDSTTNAEEFIKRKLRHEQVFGKE